MSIMHPDALFAEIRRLYVRLEADLAGLGGRCDRSGRCCRFREFGHRLYLTTPELEYLLAGLDPAALDIPDDRCPFLTAGADGRPACGNHEQRAIGCRIFFCNAADPAPFHEVYERHHAAMKELCARHGLEYRYQEVLAALRERRDAARGEAADRGRE